MHSSRKKSPKQNNEQVAEEVSSQVNSANKPSSTVTLPKSVLSFLLFLLFLLIVIGGALAFFAYQNNWLMPSKKITDNNLPTTAQEKPSSTPAPEITTAKINWLTPPQKVATPAIFKAYKEPSYDGSDDDYQMFITNQATFYKVAQMPEGELFNAYFPVNAPSDTMMIRFFKDEAGTYSVLKNYVDEWTEEELSKQLLPSVIWQEKKITQLEPPEKISLAGAMLIKQYYTGTFLSEISSPQKYDQTEYGTLYLAYQNILDSQQIYARTIYLQLPDSTVVPYTLENNLLTDDLQLNWQVADFANQQFTQSLVSACGSGLFNSVPVIKKDSLLIANKQTLAQSPQGTVIYRVVGSENDLLKKLYGVYIVGRDYPDAPPIASFPEFANQKTHFLWQDFFGDWQIFMSTNYAPMAECGKPVIYLYPTKEQQVSVQVSADITKSEPLYPANGWLVTAKPSGQLQYRGKNYPYLFWEGLGTGHYPNYQDRGVVVKRNLAVATIEKHLQQFGLNSQEIADFIEFWADKLPQKNYVRLTWLGTSDMDQLAPLAVTPKPDTRIRVFLEFEGLDQYRHLKPQKISAPKRVGFVLVEWGGLLVGE